MSLLLFKFFNQGTPSGSIAVSQKKESLAITSNELFSSSLAFSQKKHSVVITDAEIFSETLALSQNKQSIAITMTGGTAVQGGTLVQAKESISITATNTPYVYIGTIAVSQNKHSITITDSEIFSDTISLTQKKQALVGFAFSADYSTVSLTQKKESLLLSGIEKFVGTVSPSQKKQSVSIPAIEKFIASLTISSTKNTLGGGTFIPLPIYPTLFSQKKQKISITGYTGLSYSISGLESYTDSTIFKVTPLWGFTDTANYTDDINFEITTGIYTPTTNLYIYDNSDYTDATTTQPANAVTITIKSTRPQIATISSLSNYTDKIVLKSEPQNFNVINLFISTNSTYRG
jgi:hypothetical protein